MIWNRGGLRKKSEICPPLGPPQKKSQNAIKIEIKLDKVRIMPDVMTCIPSPVHGVELLSARQKIGTGFSSAAEQDVHPDSPTAAFQN